MHYHKFGSKRSFA